MVEDHDINDILMDTGCSWSLVGTGSPVRT